MKNFYKKHRKSSISIIILILIVGYYWYNKSHQPATAVQYKTAVAEKGSLITSVSGSGNIVVDQSVNIDPTITGTVANLKVNVGDKVKKGQILFSIVNDQLGVSVAQAQSSYQSSISSLRSSKSSKKSSQASYVDTKKNNTTSYADVVAARDKVDSSTASIISAQEGVNSSLANLKYQQQQAAKRNVTSPSDGTVNSINIKNGDDLSKLSSGSSRTVPMIIGDLGTMKAQIQVNEVDVPNVSIGQKVMMTFSAIEGLTMSGKIEKMDALGTITQGVVTYNVTVGFDSLDPRIKPQMSVSAKIITGVKQDIITVPNSALKTQGNRTYVQVLNNGATVPEQKIVEMGAANNTDTEIVSGINAGDNVVTQTIDPNAKSSTTSTGGGGNRGGGIPGLGGGGRG
jgi:HlyD family secretion protein